jgi:hypothetical protein
VGGWLGLSGFSGEVIEGLGIWGKLEYSFGKIVEEI